MLSESRMYVCVIGSSILSIQNKILQRFVGLELCIKQVRYFHIII